MILYLIIINKIKHIFIGNKPQNKLILFSMLGFLIYLLFGIEVLAEEVKILDLDIMQVKTVDFCIIFIEYLSKIDLSIEDQQLFCSAFQQNQKVLLKVLENLNTMEELNDYAKLIIDNALNHRKARDARVLGFIHNGLILLALTLFEYHIALHANPLALIRYPRAYLQEILSLLGEKIIRIIFGLP